MKKLYFAILFFVSSLALYTQSETAEYKEISSKFVDLYNTDNYKGVYELFSAQMQSYLPLDKTKEFISGMKAQSGTITEVKFERYENATYASYKATFEEGIFSLNIALDNDSKISGLFLKPYVDMSHPVMERNKTKLILPFKEKWDVVWGGDTKELNYHVESRAQKNAFDIVIKDESGKSYKTDGKANEDYYAFGKEIIAPCKGEIVLVVDGVKDNIPGKLNPVYVPGNTVIIKTENNEYLFFAHFKQNSIVVKQGQIIEQGDLLGLCGNSGNSSEAHIHFHIQNVENMTEATGVKCYFEEIMVNGEIRKDYSPIQNDAIRNK